MAMRLADALTDAAAVLAQAGVDQPRREARLLAFHVLGATAGAWPDPDTCIDPQAFNRAVARRAAREPLAFITGRRGFWTLDLAVSPATLVPRADSEALIEAAIAACPDASRVRRILDLGTGTGCLLLAALTVFPHATGIGTDAAPRAAALAASNAAANNLAGRASFLAADWAAPLAARFDLILCNPPYIERGALAGLMPEVRGHEPAAALDGGADGLDCYRRILPALSGLLAPRGVAILELGEGQAAAAAALAAQAGLAVLDMRPDLAGIPRALVLGIAARDEKPFGSVELAR